MGFAAPTPWPATIEPKATPRPKSDVGLPPLNLDEGAWRDALNRGKGWRQRARQGMRALLQVAPELDKKSLWKE